ncbi:MAG TPA: transglycosylase SLT domain-containing protein, partial [Casimicrobiaceae bacterium]
LLPMRGEPPERARGPWGRSGWCASAGTLTALVLCAAPALAAPTLADTLARAQGYEYGEGAPRNQRLAAALYCQAAVAGNSEAAFRLGWMYAYGRGVDHDEGTAAALFELAADEGHAFAPKSLAQMGGAMGMLPDCMRPIAPPLPDAKTVDLGDGPDPFDDLPRWKQHIADIVDRLAPSYGIEPRLALAVIAVESNFDARAISEKDARGLMQLLPQTAARFRVRNAFDARDNVRGGLAYLRWLLAYYRGDVELAAAAYNAGEKAVDRYGGVPPYRETKDYVARVLRLFPSDYHPYDSSIVAPSAVAPLDPGGRK